MIREDVTTFTQVLTDVLQSITPDHKERAELHNFLEKVLADLSTKFTDFNLDCEVQIHGSVAKDTWLSGENEIDVFIVLSKANDPKIFHTVLDIVKSYVGDNWIEAYAEHPYLQTRIGKYAIDFVPCFKIQEQEKIISAVDRSPLHSKYIINRINEELKGEIRLLKQFMHGTGLYGAEMKTGGFSGYLCELLILQYGSFLNTLKKATAWKREVIIDIANSYDSKRDLIKQLFSFPLIVIDPVDANRNVASAVMPERLGEFIMASRLFLAVPTRSLFFPHPLTTSPSHLRERLASLSFDLLAIVFTSDKTAPDVVWGQLYKTMRALKTLLIRHDFQVLKAGAWADEEQTNVILFALESITLPTITKHMGPPIDAREADTFIEKYRNAEIGPWIENDRWMVGVRRRYTDAMTLLNERLREGGRDIGIARRLIDSIQDTFTLLLNDEAGTVGEDRASFAAYLTEFLSRPRWLHSE